MPEFVGEVCQATGCGVLLDVTNLYINAHNRGQDPTTVIDQLPLKAVRQLHLVGFARDDSGELIDAHADPIQPELWSLYDYVRSVCAPDVVIIERDDDFPDFDELAGELARARACQETRETLSGR
jgi:uncharacterized protein (UPF0276 family)